MSIELQKLRTELLNDCFQKGWFTSSDVGPEWSAIPKDRVERWFKRLYTPPEGALVPGPRLINHFTLGADPEFVFVHPNGTRYDARNLGLKAGPAFGADNNSRLVELRPEPSRSALTVLTSIWSELRWLVRYYPQTLEYGWRAGAYFAQDGLGGHIHFGRKRDKLRQQEIAALDRLAHILYTAGVFDREEGRMRFQTAQGGHYGGLSDVRVQPHGWEYRTLPSWLDSLWLAYFNLVVAKLTVARCEMFPAIVQEDHNLSATQARQFLTMLLAYFAPLDDDARLAYQVLSRFGLPRSGATDFKTSWGIFSSPRWTDKSVQLPGVYPVTIPVTPLEEKTLLDALLNGTVPEATELVPTWTPTELPPGYNHAILNTETKVAPGLGELMMNFCVHDKAPWHIRGGAGGSRPLQLPKGYWNTLNACDWPRKMGIDIGYHEDERTLYVNASKDFTASETRYFVDALVRSKVIPMWYIKEVKKGSYEEWKGDKRAEVSLPTAKSSQFLKTPWS